MNDINKAKLKAWKQQQADKAAAQLDSEIRQQRILRRLGKEDPSLTHWRAMMSLRAAVEKEIRPKVAALRHARRDIYWENCELAATKPKKAVRSYVTAADLPTDPEATPEWWNAAMLRERELRKLGLLVD